jgi:hypothetical protein
MAGRFQVSSSSVMIAETSEQPGKRIGGGKEQDEASDCTPSPVVKLAPHRKPTKKTENREAKERHKHEPDLSHSHFRANLSLWAPLASARLAAFNS